MEVRRGLAAVLLLYVIMDFADPSIPGVFFFDTEPLSVDGALTHSKGGGQMAAVGETVPLAVAVDQVPEPQALPSAQSSADDH